jgi:hypothetical protein
MKHRDIRHQQVVELQLHQQSFEGQVKFQSMKKLLQ